MSLFLSSQLQRHKWVWMATEGEGKGVRQGSHPLAAKLLKMQDSSTETCFQWAVLSHSDTFSSLMQSHSPPLATQEEVQRRNCKDCNWVSPFWREQSSPHSCGEENSSQWRDWWSEVLHQTLCQSNAWTQLLILIPAKDRKEISE